MRRIKTDDMRQERRRNLVDHPVKEPNGHVRDNSLCILDPGRDLVKDSRLCFAELGKKSFVP